MKPTSFQKITAVIGLISSAITIYLFIKDLKNRNGEVL